MSISAKEAQIYDRQIRLWGLDAQKAMRNSRVLVYGMTGLSAEVCKNIVLAGVGNITIMDSENVAPSLLGTNFLIDEQSIGKNRAEASLKNLRELNPLVNVDCVIGSISEQKDEFFTKFNLVLLTRCSLKDQIRVNNICRRNGIMFFSADTFGQLAIMFQDLLDFEYQIKDQTTKEKVSKKESYVSLEHVYKKVEWKTVKRLSKIWVAIQCLEMYGDYPTPQDVNKLSELKDKFLGNHGLNTDFIPNDYISILCRNAKAELNPTCAIMGGMVAQEILKVMSRNMPPICNYFVYDGIETFAGFIETMK